MSSRDQQILDYLEEKGVCTYKVLQELLGVSSMTVRRDVYRLAEKDQIIRIIGGAQQRSTASQFLQEASILARARLNRAEKKAIAKQAMAKIVKPEQTLFIDGSSTCIELARLIAASEFAITVITHSALIALKLSHSTKITVICLGGEYDAKSGCFGGRLTEENIRGYFVDVAFVSTKAFIPDEGAFESVIATLRVKQLVAEHCGKLVLLADHTKFGQRALCKVVGKDSIHVVITDSKAPPAAIKSLRENGCEVIVAPTVTKLRADLSKQPLPA